MLPATWRHFDDGELMAIQGSDRRRRCRARRSCSSGSAWMFKGLNRARAGGTCCSGARVGMPPEALDAVRELGAASMEPAAWQAVREQAGL